MELRHFRYFVAVAEELHFGRAAARLGISQPPLSQQIRALEDELGVFLFERTSRRVHLTETGKLFLVEARRTLEQAAQARRVAQRAEHGEVGALSIGFITSAPLTPVMSKALFDYRNAFPEVHLELAEMSRSAQIDGLIERTLDIGFIRGVDPLALPAPLVGTMVLEEEMLVAMRADHPLALRTAPLRVADLADQPFVLYDRNLGAGFNEPLILLCRSAGFEPQVVQEVGGLSTLLGLVAAGFGLTVLARSLTALHLASLAYRTLDEPGAVSRLWLIHHADMSPACRRFAAIVQR